MCGINLCFGEEDVKLMNSQIDHRGVRSNYQRLAGKLFLGHVRLPIQGLSKEYDHPRRYDDLLGAFVGEIYNYKDLDPEAETDLDVLLSYYYHLGEQAFNQFDGMWSAIIHNEYRTETHIFTDQLAKKPLYIREKPFAISSEIKALLPLGDNTFDDLYFSTVAKWGYCPGNLTPFKEIRKIPRGTHIVFCPITKRIVSQKRYIDFKPDSGLSLRESLQSAVKNRTVSDVPISLLMSGGLDSTIIYYLLREFKKDITIFHVDNDEAKYLDYIDFRQTDKLIKINIDEEYDLDHILSINEGPVDLGSLIPQTLLAKEISKHGFNVCLSGDGADELFGGYKRSKEYDSQYSDIYHELVHYHLPRLDKTMMAHTIELRCPFLSPEVISKALSLPYKDRINKHALKYDFRDLVPSEILKREKQPLRYRTEKLNRHRLIEEYKSLMKKKGIVI